MPVTFRKISFFRTAGLVFMLLLPGYALAQNGRISGRVTDTGGLPIPGANILVEGTTSGTATDSDGRYSLPVLPAGTYVIRFSVIGFRTKRRTVQVDGNGPIMLNISLTEDILESGEVVVTASRREQPANTVPVSVSILTARDLAVRNVVVLDDALRTISGVHIQDNQVNIRGSSGYAFNTGSRVLLLLDGMPLLSPDTDGVPFDALPFAQIERIEVLKGPGSSLYGSGALGGVINVITRDFPEKPESLVRIYGGAFQPVRYKIWKQQWNGADKMRTFGGFTFTHARKTSERFGFWVNLDYRGNQGYMNFNEAKIFHGYGKIGWKPGPAYRFDMVLGWMRRKKDNFLFWNGARDALNPGSINIGTSAGNNDPATPPSGTSDNLTNQITLLPAFTHLVNDQFYYTIRGRLFGAVLQPIDNLTGKPKPVKAGGIGFRYGTEVQFNYAPVSGRYLTLGATGDALASRNDLFVSTDGDDFGSQPEGALFVQWEEAITDQLQLVSGLRFDGYRIDERRSETKLSPKLSAAWSPSRTVMFRAAFGDGFRVPSFGERFTDDRDFFPIVRNLGLRPERSRSFEAGMKTRSRVPGKGLLRSELTLFRNDYWNLIEPKLIPDLRAFQFINLTRARITGIESSLEWSIPDRGLSAKVGYTFLETNDLTTGMPLAFRSRHLFIVSFDGKVLGPLDFGLDYRFVSKPEQLDSDFALFVSDADLLVDTSVLDLRIAITSGALRVAFIVKNATEYYYLERPALLGAPRRAILQMQVQF